MNLFLYSTHFETLFYIELFHLAAILTFIVSMFSDRKINKQSDANKFDLAPSILEARLQRRDGNAAEQRKKKVRVIDRIL